jgi:hypothetical protein
MPTRTNSIDTVENALLRGIIDDASLAPPRSLPMPAAVDAHFEAKAQPWGWIVGHFMVPAARLDDLARALIVRPDRQIGLGVVLGSVGPDVGALCDTMSRFTSAFPHARIRAVEFPITRNALEEGNSETLSAMIDGQFQTLPDTVTDLYVEIPVTGVEQATIQTALQVLSRLARTRTAPPRLHAKVRCGGLEQRSFPSTSRLATLIKTCAQEKISFKATQGLHHPVRTFDDEIGVVQHGFFNIVAATALLHDGRITSDDLEHVLADNGANFRIDAAGLWWRDKCVAPSALRDARAFSFKGFGSCSLAEPVDDLQRQGLTLRGLS